MSFFHQRLASPSSVQKKVYEVTMLAGTLDLFKAS